MPGAGAVTDSAAAVPAAVVDPVTGGTAVVPVEATATVPPKSPMSLANEAFRSARDLAETLDFECAASFTALLLPKSWMSAVSSAAKPR